MKSSAGCFSSLSVFALGAALAGCGASDGASPAGSASAAAASAAPTASAVAAAASRVDVISTAYKQAFRGGVRPNEERAKDFLAKAGPPDAEKDGTKIWYGRDAEGSCFEMKLPPTYTFSSSKIFDEKEAAAKCK